MEHLIRGFCLAAAAQMGVFFGGALFDWVRGRFLGVYGEPSPEAVICVMQVGMTAALAVALAVAGR